MVKCGNIIPGNIISERFERSMSMNIRIVADSGCDINKSLKEKMDISLVPLSIHLDGKEFRDDENLDTRKLLQEMKECPHAPSTASPSPEAFLEEYQKADSIFVVTISSQLSSTYNHALMAKKMILEQKAKKFIHVFDSLSASIGETLVSMKIFELASQNMSELDIVSKVNAYIKEMKTFFVLESLDNLIKAGRINKILGTLATALSMKPIMGGTEEGTIKIVEKVRGSRKAFNRLVDLIGEVGEMLDEKILGIAHCNCLKKAEELKNEVMKRYRFKDIIIVEMGGVSTVYANDGRIVIAF